MSREIKVGAIQPAGGDLLTVFCPKDWESREANIYVIDTGINLLKKITQERVDIVCLPELFDIFGLEGESALKKAKIPEENEIVTSIQKIARDNNLYVILPVLEKTKNNLFYNTTLIIDRQGRIVGRYRKVHLTDHEKESFKVSPGDAYPVFKLDFGTIGIMTCYDSYFPEVSRILTLNGAEIIFYPRWQSGPSEISQEIQMRARAIDYCVYIVSSSYGIEKEKSWKPGMFFGRSKIIDPDGTIIADAGHYMGYISATIDLDKKVLMDVLDRGGDVRDLKELKLRDRRPETYKAICEPKTTSLKRVDKDKP